MVRISVRKTYSVVDIMKDLNQTFHDEDPAFYSLPETRNLVAQYLLLYEGAGGTEAQEYLSSDYQRARLDLRLRLDMASETVRVGSISRGRAGQAPVGGHDPEHHGHRCAVAETPRLHREQSDSGLLARLQRDRPADVPAVSIRHHGNDFHVAEPVAHSPLQAEFASQPFGRRAAQVIRPPAGPTRSRSPRRPSRSAPRRCAPPPWRGDAGPRGGCG